MRRSADLDQPSALRSMFSATSARKMTAPIGAALAHRTDAARLKRYFAIFLALVFQFKNAIKPFIVFAAVPFGMVGALAP